MNDPYMTKQLEKIIGGETVCVTKLRLPLKAKKDGSNTVNYACSGK